MTWRTHTWSGVRRVVLGIAGGESGSDASDSDNERSFREIEVVNWPNTKTESLERTLDRAESVVDGQLSTLADVDDKAIRTVRLAVVLLGVVVSITGVAPEAVPVNTWTKSGVALLVGSVAAGIFTYSTSPPDFGPGPKYVHSNIAAGDANDDVYLELLHGYDDAIAHNRDAITDSARYLFVVQTLLVGGILVGLVGCLLAP